MHFLRVGLLSWMVLSVVTCVASNHNPKMGPLAKSVKWQDVKEMSGKEMKLKAGAKKLEHMDSGVHRDIVDGNPCERTTPPLSPLDFDKQAFAKEGASVLQILKKSGGSSLSEHRVRRSCNATKEHSPRLNVDGQDRLHDQEWKLTDLESANEDY